MDTNENHNHITTTRCDLCAGHGPAVLHHYQGTPHTAVCKACDPRYFEAVARQDIDAWLAGGDTFAFGR